MRPTKIDPRPMFGPDAPPRTPVRDLGPGLPAEGAWLERDRARRERTGLELQAQRLREARGDVPRSRIRSGPDPSDPADVARWREARRWADNLHQRSVDTALKSDIHTIATHEATHAAVARTLGARLLRMTTVASRSERASCDHDAASLIAGPERPMMEAVIALAAAHGERFSPTWRDSYRDHSGGGSDRTAALRSVRGDEALLARLDEHAAELVAELEPQIRALAAALADRGSLTGDEAAQILDEADKQARADARAAARTEPVPLRPGGAVDLDAMTLEALGRYAWRRIDDDAPEAEFTAIVAAIDRKQGHPAPGRRTASPPPWERRQPGRRGVETRDHARS